MVSKKSMAQLQWEARQISPRKDEMVERYLEEKDEHGSQFRDAYRELKRELNMFRHYHWQVENLTEKSLKNDNTVGTG
jgi:hypothetical protein